MTDPTQQPAPPPKECCYDFYETLENGLSRFPRSCVFDDPDKRISSCMYAEQLKEQDMPKESCFYYQQKTTWYEQAHSPEDICKALNVLVMEAWYMLERSSSVYKLANPMRGLASKVWDWAIPCQPTAFDAGDGWIVHRMADAWHFARPGWRMPKSPPYTTARAAWEALQQLRAQEGQQ